LNVTGEQLRAARAMARIEQSDLARASKVSIDTIKRLERTMGPVSANVATVNSVVQALETAGIEFTNGDRPGVRMKPWEPGETVRLRQASQGYASTLGIGPKEFAVIEEWKAVPGQVPGGHFRLRLASGIVLQGLSASHFERVPPQETEGQ
jgi:transcriptional regulator with XRE-family HTH domain